MADNKLAQDEARRATQLETLKTKVETKVDSTITEQAQKGLPEDEQRIDSIASDLRHKLIDEVGETEREVARARVLARVAQVVDYLFGVIYALLGMRFILALVGANPAAGFVRFIKTVTTPLGGPFKGILPSPATESGMTLALPLLIAVGAYAMLHLGIKGLLRMTAHRKTQI